MFAEIPEDILLEAIKIRKEFFLRVNAKEEIARLDKLELEIKKAEIRKFLPDLFNHMRELLGEVIPNKFLNKFFNDVERSLA